ncbi:hypothetical protein LMG27177_07571 [Paraburkholderia fynbosensis]|uniref:HTH tetR-type domain-containing protein n=2 Tax=Paraburkholderia fynbosensis TaxID=1200993 RepID=A0A6J5H3C6_9BURK|nr:hypothetical protein LMG27177_07571 [Paraburkholderia fynbosensis]
MVQARGYNALSFRDIAKEVGIKSAGVHHHFATKGDLGTALAREYCEEALRMLDALSKANDDDKITLDRYTQIFRAALIEDNRMCLCGIMAAEYQDLPSEVRAEVARFTRINVEWLTSMFAKGDDPAAARKALSVFAAIEGAQLVARGRGDISVYDEAIRGYRASGLLP